MFADAGEATGQKPLALTLPWLTAGTTRTYVRATHVLVWLLLFSVVMSLPLLLNDPRAGRLYPVYLYRVGAHFMLLVGLFYFNAAWLIPRYLFRQRPRRYALLIVLAIAGVQLFYLWIDKTFGLARYGLDNAGPPGPNLSQPFDPFYLFSWLWAFLIVGVSTSLTVTQQWLRDAVARQALEKERLSSELRTLKTQVNPHFFFNSLNTVYALTEANPSLAREAVHRLSKVMRHVLRETERESILLSEEIVFMQHYVELMKMRLPAQVQVEYAFPTAGTDLSVPPLLFIPFIENAFKHGVGVGKECLIRVALKRSGTRLHLHVSNPNVSGRADAPAENNAAALTDVRRRLQLLYPGRHALRIEDGGPDYLVDLTIDVREDVRLKMGDGRL
jgi:hypothetical protein